LTVARTAAGAEAIEGEPPHSGLTEYDRLYRQTVGAVLAYFARRSSDPQIVADLTSETFERAAGAFRDLDARKSSARAWLFGIAAEVDAVRSVPPSDGSQADAVAAVRVPLEGSEVAELAAKIDAEHTGRELLAHCGRLSALDRHAIELVELAGLTPEEAAAALGVYTVVLRTRLARARSRLVEENQSDG
jgi:RNA polymerase sigma-70 factor (ECF subfamily)